MLINDLENRDLLQGREYENIGWAELNRTGEDARNSLPPTMTGRPVNPKSALPRISLKITIFYADHACRI